MLTEKPKTMMMLRSGWKASIGYPSSWRWFHRAEDNWDAPYAVDTGDGQVFAWANGFQRANGATGATGANGANGASQRQAFSTVREAHAYLVSVGSESPWEEVC